MTVDRQASRNHEGTYETLTWRTSQERMMLAQTSLYVSW